MEFITRSAEETQDIDKKIIKKLISQPRLGALVLALSGELGAGKTTFIQGLARILGVKGKILSPTFVIMKYFALPKNKYFINFYHFDAYRLTGEKDLISLGGEEILKNKNNLVVIEWPEKIKNILPQDAVWLNFEHLGEDKRRIKILNF